MWWWHGGVMVLAWCWHASACAFAGSAQIIEYTINLWPWRRVKVEISNFYPKSSFRRIETGVVHFRTSRSQRDHSRVPEIDFLHPSEFYNRLPVLFT